MDIITVLLISGRNLVCFFVGSKVGRAIVKGEKIEVPNLNPIDAVREHRAQKEAQKQAEWEQIRLNTIMENIDNYDGTDRGQKDIPRG